MATSREAKTLRKELILQETCREAYFTRMQRIYDSSSQISSPESVDSFICASETIDDIRHDFMKTIHAINSINMELDTNFVPDFNIWSALEDLYCKIRRVRNQLLNSSNDSKPQIKELKPPASKLRLPPIEIPNFHGNVNNWNLFYETFKSTIHNNSDLTNSEKLYYLLGKLKGSAQLVFAGINPTADNYESIWNALVLKYQDKRFLATSILDSIFEMKPLPNPATATQLESFIDKYAASIAALQDLKIPSLCDYIFIYIALKRRPRYIQVLRNVCSRY